ncbi:DUF2079 domain-containing protein [Candidatus Uhrbacteria bacterium]|nr:DUF2079 domain-containing protein [Candidatus Uhrbacteria bacterium]
MWFRWYHRTALSVAIVTFTIAVSAVGFWKYAHYRYQGMDLAIYANVLWSLTHGGGWWSSVQGSMYLGDHVEPILLLIAPLFRLWSDPRLLIVVQALALGLTAIPMLLLLRHFSRVGNQESGIRDSEIESKSRSIIHNSYFIILSALWLLNPLLWNAALFEFHALSFAPLFLLSAAYAYLRRRFWWFLLWVFLALMVREDVALIVVMFGVVELVRKHQAPSTKSQTSTKHQISNKHQAPHATRHWFGVLVLEYVWNLGFGIWNFITSRMFLPRMRTVWVAVPMTVGALWFLLATRIAAIHSANGAYKFLIYYGWLRDAASHSLAFLQHIVSIGNIDMVLGLLLPFLFLPILRPRWLVLAIPPFLQILLAAPGGSSVVIETHYALLFLPALILASIDAMQTISPPLAEGEREGVRGRKQARLFQLLARRFPLPQPFAITLGIAVYLAAAILIGPSPGIAQVVVHGASPDDRARRAAYDELLARVPSDSPVAVGYAALPHVAARRGAYALPYAYLGVNQYAFASYELPDTTRYLLLDQRDAITYAVQFPDVGWTAPHAVGGPERLRTLIERGRFGVVAERDGIALLERDVGGALPATPYFTPATPPHGRLGIDGLRDVIVQ